MKALRFSILGALLLTAGRFEVSSAQVSSPWVQAWARAAQAKELRVLAATTTLAMGVNTPAEAVVIAGLLHPGPESEPYSIAEYKNIVGRAGRLGFATRHASKKELPRIFRSS